jgi:hypothetical protein
MISDIVVLPFTVAETVDDSCDLRSLFFYIFTQNRFRRTKIIYIFWMEYYVDAPFQEMLNATFMGIGSRGKPSS